MLALRRVSKSFLDKARPSPVLENITLDIPEHEFVSICLLYTSDAADE